MKQTIWKIFKSYISSTGRKSFLWVLLFSFLTAFVTVVEPVIFTRLISYIEEFLKTGIFDEEKVLYLIIFWVLFSILAIAIQYIYRYIFVYKKNMQNYVDLCKEFNAKIIHMWYSEYLWKKQWSLYKIYDRGTMWQEQFLYFFFWEAVRTGFSVSIISCILFYVDYRMAILAFSMVPVMLILWYFFITKLSVRQKKLNDDWDVMYGTIWNILSSFHLTKILTLEIRFLRKMSLGLDDVLVDQHKLSKWWALVNIYTAALVVFARIIVLWVWVYFVVNGSLTFTELFLVFSYIGWIYFPIGFLIDKFNNVVRDLTSVEKMYKEFWDIEMEDINKWKSLKKIEWNIDFKNVEFWYSDEKKILKWIDIEIKKGQQIALVGNTWAGKSTIVNLLLRFWETSSWEILLDGQNIKNLKKSSLRNHIWVVSQDNSLFNLTIEENLKFSNLKATKKDMEDALKKAEADFVFKLKDWIKTIIWERWLKLSWGEKQRLSIARLFLKNPEILVLDEATSALDNVTEKKISKALTRLMKWKTSIVIAHRLSTIQHADKIYVLEDGKVIESWNYEKLMKDKWKFYSLANPDKLVLA